MVFFKARCVVSARIRKIVYYLVRDEYKKNKLVPFSFSFHISGVIILILEVELNRSELMIPR